MSTLPNISSILANILAVKTGDKSFILTNEGGGCGGEWLAAIGNATHCVIIGEAIAYGTDEKHVDFYGVGSTPEAAMMELYRKVSAL